jgi:hypothetical protein
MDQNPQRMECSAFDDGSSMAVLLMLQRPIR